MNQRQTEPTSASRRGWLRGLVWIVSVPIVLLLIGGVIIGVREFRAASELQTKLNQLKQAGEPYDNASMDQWYRRRTHPEGAQAWVQILESVSTISQLAAIDNLPFVGNGKELRQLDPQSEWRHEPTVKEFLSEMQDLIQQIHQLKKWPVPVQFPLEIHGAQTLLTHYQQSTSIARLLQLDFEYAFYHKEFDRALEDLRSIGNVAKAIDTEFCQVVELVVMATVGMQNEGIQRSLLTDSWSPEQLSELREIVSHVRFSSAKWKNLMANERAMFGDDIASGDLSRIAGRNEASLVPLLQTGRLRIFVAYNELINIGNSELTALKSASKHAMDRIVKRDATLDVDGASIWIGMLLPAVEQMAYAVENEESNRRLTLTAVALRQFKLQEGHWPIRLSELEKVGLTPTSYNTFNRGEFGYETSDGVAYMWGSDLVRDLPVDATRPIGDLDTRKDGRRVITLR